MGARGDAAFRVALRADQDEVIVRSALRHTPPTVSPVTLTSVRFQ
jgi:hypothetical protein